MRNDEFFEVVLNNVWNLTEDTYDYVSNEVEDQTEKPKPKKNLKESYEGKFHEDGKPTPYGIDKKVNMGDMNPDKRTKRFSPELEKFVASLKKRGTRGIMSLRRAFDVSDKNGNGSIDYSEFQEMVERLRIDLKPAEIKTLFNEFDKDGSGEIDYNEFVDLILSDVPKSRIARLKQVFFILDKDSSGGISQDELKDGYHYKRHPDVLKGKKSPEEVFSEFLDNLEYHFTLLKSEANPNEMTINQFIDFYKNISFIYLDSDSFNDYLTAVWALDV